MRATILTISFIIFNVALLAAQITGTIDNKNVGLRFMIPEGWTARESGQAIVISAPSEAVFMVVTEHTSTSLAQIKQEADEGIEDETLALQRTGEYEAIGTQGVGAEFTGTMQSTPAKAYIIGLVNPYGNGLTILVLAETNAYSAKYKNLALAFAKSVKFTKPITSPVLNAWKAELNNRKLTYLSSYNSGGGGGGMSEQEEIHLCAAGYFKYSSSSSVSMNVEGASGSSSGTGAGTGKWDVTSDANGNAALKLTFDDGNVKSYRLTSEGTKTFLNGKRYFKTSMQDEVQHRPNCP